MSSCALCWDKQPATGLVHGTAWKITGNICLECIKYVGVDDWEPSGSLSAATYNYTKVADWDWGGDPWEDMTYGKHGAIQHQSIKAPLCHHHLTPFSFEGLDNTYKVHLSGSSHLRQEPSIKELPTVGVYLDAGWLSGRLATNSDIPVDLAQPTSIYIGWPDFGILPLELIDEAVKWVLPYLYDKNNIVEIACMGGHGRTGTFLAAVMIREGWATTDAIEYIRGGYCNKAIESLEQEDMLAQYHKLVNGVETHENSNQQVH